MDWITSLVKHVTASNKLMASLLVTAIIIIVVPKYYPNVKPVPEDWQWIPFAVGIFSSVMLLLSLLIMIGHQLTNIPKVLKNLAKLNDLEYQILSFLWETKKQETLNIDHLTIEGVDHLDILAARDELEARKFIFSVFMSPNVIGITEGGRSYLIKNKKKYR